MAGLVGALEGPFATSAVQRGLYCACAGGCDEVLDALADPRFGVTRELLGPMARSLLRLACRTGSSRVLARLARAPYSLGRAELLEPPSTDSPLMAASYAPGSTGEALFRELEREPWDVTQSDLDAAAVATGGGYLAAVARCGGGGTIRALLAAPYAYLSRDEWVRECIDQALVSANVGVLEALCEPRLKLYGKLRSSAAVPKALGMAVARGRIDVVRLLHRPPFSCSGAVRGMPEALLGAVADGRDDVLAALAEGPGGIDGDFLRSVEGLEDHVCSHARVLEALGRPPFDFGCEYARSHDLLARACHAQSVEALYVLARPPYSLGHSDAEAAESDESDAQVTTTVPSTDNGDPAEATMDAGKTWTASLALREGSALAVAT
eukprot:m51a1_g12882 hypothetical protein (381) ;mRNA; r:345-2089